MVNKHKHSQTAANSGKQQSIIIDDDDEDCNDEDDVVDNNGVGGSCFVSRPKGNQIEINVCPSNRFYV